MIEKKENKGSGLKYFLFIGIPVLIILTVLGVYYYMANPKTMLVNTINRTYETLNQLWDTQTESVIENPISIHGNISFKTNANNEIINELQEYQYPFQIDYSEKEKYFNLKLGIENQEKELVDMKFIGQNDKFYLASEKLYDGILDITNDINITSSADINNQTTNDMKKLLEKGKNYFIESIDESNLKREKVNLTIKDKTLKASKITYELSVEKQKETVDFIINKIINDDEALTILANIQKKEKETIRADLQTYKSEISPKEPIEIIIYTEGLKQNVIKVELLENKKSIIDFTDDKKEKQINIQNKLILTIVEYNDDNINLNYELPEQNINGTIIIKQRKKENNSTEENLHFTIKAKKLDIAIDLNLELNENATIAIPTITNAKTPQELTSEEIGDIFYNLEEALKNTIFYSFIENSIM